MKFTIMRLTAHALHAQPSSHRYYKTAAGILKLSYTQHGIYQAAFCEEQPTSAVTQIPHQLCLVGTDFQITVWNAALQIPEGKTVTYQEIAQTIGKPTAWRAVANALAHNTIAYFIPCHRVVRTNGALGGYKWGIEKKQMLLSAEKL